MKVNDVEFVVESCEVESVMEVLTGICEILVVMAAMRDHKVVAVNVLAVVELTVECAVGWWNHAILSLQYSVLCHQAENREQMPEMHMREQMYLKLPSFGCR